MISWEKNTLELRASYWHMNGFEVRGTLPSPSAENHLDTDYDIYIASLQYQLEDWTISSEASYRRGIGTVEVPALNVYQDYGDRRKAAYISATYHLHPELDLYVAAEYIHFDFIQFSQVIVDYSAVGAVAYRPLENWSLKAEVQYIDGEVDPLVFENPNGINSNWWIFALKTTVDF